LRKSIALLTTIFFLISIVFILNIILKNYQAYLKEKPVFIAENSIIIKNTLKTLFEISDNIKNISDLQKIFTTIPLSSNEGDFRIVYTIKPLFDRIDINALLRDNKINPDIENYIDNILRFYKIKDPLFFKDLLLDTIDQDTEEREGYSEIVLTNPCFQNGKIYNFKHLKQIENYYYKRTDDKNIYNIPWDELIFFGDGSKHILECHLISKKVADFLELDYEELNCADNNEILKNLNIISYDKNKSFWIESDITYFLEKQNNIKIIYDINKKKVISIESYPIY